MKELAKKYWITAILLAAPLIRHFSENSTIDALTSVIVWGSLWLVFVVVLICLLVGCAMHFAASDMKVDVDGAEKMLIPFNKLKWWKSGITASLILGVFIYVDWSGPAVLYLLNVAGMWSCMYIIKSGIEKVCEAQGIELTWPGSDSEDDKPDELKNLKKSMLD